MLFLISIINIAAHMIIRNNMIFFFWEYLARLMLKVIAARLMQYVTSGDGGSEVNAGGYITELTVKPKRIDVTI
jgi:hypothetical protein